MRRIEYWAKKLRDRNRGKDQDHSEENLENLSVTMPASLTGEIIRAATKLGLVVSVSHAAGAGADSIRLTSGARLARRSGGRKLETLNVWIAPPELL